MKSIRVWPVVGLLASITLTTSYLATAADTVEPVVVTATRTAESADASLSPMILIDNAEITRQPGTTVEDILRMHAGIEVGRNGGPGQTTSIFIRGADSNHTLVMLDGVRINPGTIGGASIQNIDPSIIERIEVVKGPRSTLYGSDAIGGVINIITRRGTKPGTDYSIAAGGGSYDTKTLKFSASNRTADKAAGIQFSGTNSHGFPTRTSSTIDRGHDNINVNLFGSQKIGQSLAEISYWHAQGQADYLDSAAIPIDQDFENNTTTVTIRNTPATNWASTIKFSHIVDKIQQNQSTDYVKTSRYALDWQNDIGLGKQNLVTTGFYLADENTGYSSTFSAFEVDTTAGAVFIQDVMENQAHKLVAGARYNKHETFGSHTTWNLEYGYSFSSQFKLILANNSGFRAPDSTDRFGFGGNINLQPETSVNSEIGLRYHITARQRLELNVFRNTIDNLINYDFTTLQLENTDKAEIEGVEVAYNFMGQPWVFSANAVVQNPYDITNDSQLLRRAEHIYSLYGGYKTSLADIGLNISYSGKRPDIDPVSFARIHTGEYTLVNLTGRYQYTSKLALSGRLENLTDEDYELAAGYNTPGRSLFAELNYQF